MVFSQRHVLLRFNGHFGGSGTTVLDRWSVGLRFGKNGADSTWDPAKLQTFADASAILAATFHASASAATGSSCWLDNCTGAVIGLDGKYDPITANTAVSSSIGPTAGSGSIGMPWNTAHVISLRTSIPRGRASNGRCYWPALAKIVDPNTGRMSAGDVAGRLANFVTFANALNTAANVYEAGTRLRVFSNVGLGTQSGVVAVRADNRLDSIERRENQQPTVYQTTALA